MKISTILIMPFLFACCLCGAAQTPKAPVEVPFEFLHNQIIVQVKVNGKGPLNMLIDTDTDPSAIDSATAKELGLQVGTSGASASGGGTGTSVVYPTRLASIELGGVSAKDVVAATIDLTKIGERIGKPVQGVLGFSFLKDRIVQIDYEHSKLRFFAVSPYPRIDMTPNTVNTIALSFRREDGDVIVDSVFINNEKMRATLDTGSSGTFTLTPEAIAILNLDDQAQDGKGGQSIGYNGTYENKSVPADFWLPNTGHDKKKYQVNIGNGFFQDFMMTFDFKNKIVVFEKMD